MFSVIAYLIAVVLANMTVYWFGPISTPINAFFLIGLDLTLRDKLHDRWMDDKLWLKMFMLIAAGSAITFVINRNAGNIALASVISFALAALVDAVSYSMLHKRSFMIRSNGSNLASSLADSILFPTIAFGTLMPWVILGQFVAKISGGFLWSLLLNKLQKKELAQ
ncbi:MAG: VUT family protein [Bacteroidota bacterium]|nr:VUT family protein [Bacteroidota bacterium]MDP4191341.1 VUT family protein [Bacteroidota bacterium]MDP4195884.1 VUT family protein [Bacteroidota bacterium]